MKRDGWPICAGVWAFLMSLTLGSVAMAADPGVGVVFQQPGPGATVNGGVAVLFEGFGGADPAGNGIVSRHFVLEIDGATVADFTGTFPFVHQEATFFWDTSTYADGPHLFEVTVTDENGRTASATTTINLLNHPGGRQPVVWASPVKVAVDGNSIIKPSGCHGCADAGAISQQTIPSGSGSVEFEVSANAYLTVGLSHGNPGTTGSEIAFGLRFSPGVVEVRESGVYKADWRQAGGAVYKIAVDGGSVKYYQNGTLKYTSTQAPVYPLLLDSSLLTRGAGVLHAFISGGGGGGITPGTLPPGPGSGSQAVVWTNAVKVAVSGNTITKSTGCDGCWDAGATSEQTISSASGFVEFAVSSGTSATVGLSAGTPGTSANAITFGLRFYPGSPGIVEVRETGVYKWDWLHVAGAVYKVAVDAGAVKYYQNGVLKYTSAVAATPGLVLDATVDLVGNAVQNAVIAP